MRKRIAIFLAALGLAGAGLININVRPSKTTPQKRSAPTGMRDRYVLDAPKSLCRHGDQCRKVECATAPMRLKTALCCLQGPGLTGKGRVEGLVAEWTVVLDADDLADGGTSPQRCVIAVRQQATQSRLMRRILAKATVPTNPEQARVYKLARLLSRRRGWLAKSATYTPEERRIVRKHHFEGRDHHEDERDERDERDGAHHDH